MSAVLEKASPLVAPPTPPAPRASAVAFFMPTRLAFGAEVVRPTDVARAALVLNVLLIIGFGLGPVTAGLLKQRFDWDVLFAVVAVALTLSSALLLFARAHTRRPIAR